MEAINPLVDKIKANVSYDELIPELIDMLKFILKNNTRENREEIVRPIKKIGSYIKKECPTAFPIFNILSRVISLISKNIDQGSSTENLQNKKLMKLLNKDRTDITEGVDTNIIEVINDLNELEHAVEYLIAFAKVHVNEGETILVFSQSKLIEQFISSCFEDKNIFLIIVENEFSDRKKIKEKAERVLYVTQNSVFSLMPKINKIFMDCHSLMADGAIIGEAGAFNIALIAKEFAVPLYILSPIYKFTPLYAFAQDTFNERVKPQTIFNEAEGVENLDIVVERYNLVPSEYAVMIVTENGEYSTDYIYRVFSEYYADSDYGYQF